MSCDFKPGDEVVIVAAGQLWDGVDDVPTPDQNHVYVCEDVVGDLDRCETCGSDIGVHINDGNSLPICPCLLRKAQKRNDSLSIEAFSVIKDGGFEEPKRAPAKKRERV